MSVFPKLNKKRLVVLGAAIVVVLLITAFLAVGPPKLLAKSDTVGFCAGCAVYYWLGKLRLPGFVKDPPPGTFPGMRPKSS